MYFRQRNPLDAVYRMHKMYRLTKFVVQRPGFWPRNAPQQSARGSGIGENLPDFHGAKTI